MRRARPQTDQVAVSCVPYCLALLLCHIQTAIYRCFLFLKPSHIIKKHESSHKHEGSSCTPQLHCGSLLQRPNPRCETRLCDVSVTGGWGRIDDSVTAGGLERGARGMQPSIADENTRVKTTYNNKIYSSSIRQRRQQEMQKCSE